MKFLGRVTIAVQPVFAILLTACAIGALVVGPGCEPRRAKVVSTSSNVGPTNEAETAIFARLEQRADLEHVRQVLQELDNHESASSRPVLAASESENLKSLFHLTSRELADLSQQTFTAADAAYVEECLLIRSGVRSLGLDSKAEMERAIGGFAWACRMVVIDDRIPWPAPPWYSLQTGSGMPMSRAYAILAAWSQLGLDGVIVGPSDLKDQLAFKFATRLGNPPTVAPIRAIGVKIGNDIALFDHTAGTPLRTVGGGKPITLAQAKADPGLVKTLAESDEVKKWQAFVSPPSSGFSRRMEWLEKFSPETMKPRLYVDIKASIERLEAASKPVAVWCPVNDGHCLSRVGFRYATEEPSQQESIPLRDQHRIAMVPLELMPKTLLVGTAGGMLKRSYAQYFNLLRYTTGSPRDLMLRGNYTESLAGLAQLSGDIDNARTRIDQDKFLQNDFNMYAEKFQELAAILLRAEQSKSPNAPAAAKAFDTFRNVPKSREVERAYVLGHASRPLGAEVLFLTAATVHERAERSEAERSPSAQENWKNAVDWWKRFLNNVSQSGGAVPGREKHARDMLNRCEAARAKK